MGGSRGGGGGAGGPDPPEKAHTITSNIDPDPLKITKLPSHHSMVGHYRHASETPWRFAGGPMMANKKKEKKVSVGPL